MTPISITVILTALTILPVIGVLIFLRRMSAGGKRARMRDPAPGTLLVTATSLPPRSAAYGNGNVTGVLTAPGLPATAVRSHAIYPVRKWPQLGTNYPVVFDRADPNLFAFDWDRVEKTGDAALAETRALAEAMRRGESRG